MEIIKLQQDIYRITEDSGCVYDVNGATEQLAIEKYNAIKFREANPTPPSYQELRKKEYPSIGDMVIALWEWQVEGRNEAKNILQIKREAVKLKYPKG